MNYVAHINMNCGPEFWAFVCDHLAASDIPRTHYKLAHEIHRIEVYGGLSLVGPSDTRTLVDETASSIMIGVTHEYINSSDTDVNECYTSGERPIIQASDYGSPLPIKAYEIRMSEDRKQLEILPYSPRSKNPTSDHERAMPS